MKKLLVFCLLCCCILLAGCGKDNSSTKKEDNTNKDSVLSCSRSTESTVNFSTEMIYYFKSNKLDRLGVKYTYDLSAYTEEQRKVFAGSKMCEMESMTTTLGMTDCKEELSGTNYIVTGNADKLLAQSTGTLSVIKASYEKDGWNCSVK